MRLILACLIVVLSTVSAGAKNDMCGWVEEFEGVLRDRHGEVPVSAGAIDEQGQFRVYASPEGKTWTAMLVTADGMACVVTAGEFWKQAPVPTAPKKPERKI